MNKHTAADLKQMQSLPLEVADGIWQQNKDGLGLARVMEFIGVPYE